ncbi:zinc-dependent alcohol dehydrogenase [Alicyclobacillus macrosporangiidus]|uniref:2-desacetyl-2-hydroxyethyl bacteriochlorophyllide A dehydrogenase n=1 Tax=Alicyclobacillus macrosporangiidus TaxID=392015 RepID=A0A1I7GZW0_9BACL|nr:alcohol dehydrogenase catalytic domain-containing protein [Alicyclobacillus macrosporangiidus]SFU53979.1 2-desacetyl-2-hydroxyethyl bacteriochlorophyllide A dehydrogenase [Alicyclobacillus macrosporangiidus]
MQAYVWTGPRRFETREMARPEPGPGEVLLRVLYSGICGSELSGYLGENSLRKPPLVMGHEFTGEVAALGDGAKGVSVGDVVAVNPLIACGRCPDCLRGMPQYCPEKAIIGIHRPGSFAEYVVVPADRCHRVQDALAGALVEPLACGLRAAAQAQVSLGDSVVVYGAGIIGLFSLLAAKLRGAAPLVLVDTNDERLALGVAFGATHTANPRREDVVQVVRRLTGAGADRAIDAVGLTATRQGCVDVLRSGGRMAWIGLHEDDTRVQGNVVVRKELEVAGCFCYTEDDFRLAHRLVDSGVVRPDEAWLDVRPMGAIQEAFDEQIDGPARYPKLVLVP